jgi:hypothetical protein
MATRKKAPAPSPEPPPLNAAQLRQCESIANDAGDRLAKVFGTQGAIAADLADLLHTSLDRQRKLAVMFGAIFELCDTAESNEVRSATDGLWDGLMVVADHLADMCAEASDEVARLHQLTQTAMAAGGAR